MQSVITKGMVILGLVTLVAWGGMKEAHAISNGGFETGSFASWTTIGNTSIETAAFMSGPTEGTYQALLNTNFGSSDSNLESFLGLSSGGVKPKVS